MLTKEDVAYLLKEALVEFDERLDKKFDRKLGLLRTDIRDEMHAMEKRMINRMDAMETRITSNVAEILDTSVLPQIAELQARCA